MCRLRQKGRKMKNDDFMNLLADPEFRNSPLGELQNTLQEAFKRYEWRMRSERIKAGIREAKLRKTAKAE